MKTLINKITGQWSAVGIIDKTDEDIYEYGLDLLLYTILNLTVVLCSAALAGKMAESIALLVVILPLQSIGGGYHAKTHLRCFLIMYIAWWIVILLLPLVTPIYALVIAISTMFIVFNLAPIANENVKMSANQMLKMRKIVRVVVSLVVLVSVICLFSIYRRIGLTMSTGLGAYSLSMLIAHAKNKLKVAH